MVQRYLQGSPAYHEKILGMDAEAKRQNDQVSYLLLSQPAFCKSRCLRCFTPPWLKKLGDDGALKIKDRIKLIKESKEVGIVHLENSALGEGTDTTKGAFTNESNWERTQAEIEISYELGMTYLLISNGQNDSSEMLEWMMQFPNISYIVSLGTLRENIYALDCGLKDKGIETFHRVIETIKTARQIFGKPYEKNGALVYRVGIHACEQAHTFDEIESGELMQFAEDLGIFYSVASVADLGCAKDHPDIILPKADLEQVTFTPLKKGYHSIIHTNSSIPVCGRSVCGTCFDGLSIMPNGLVLFDAHCSYELYFEYIKTGRIFLGKWPDQTLKTIVPAIIKAVEHMFENIGGFCPARSKDFPEYIQKYI